MATTPETVALQKGAITYAQPEQAGTKKAVDLMSTLLSTPTLPTGTSIAPTLQTLQTGETQATPGVTGAVTAGVPTAPTAPTVTTATAPTAGTVTAPTAQAAGQYTAGTVIGSLPTATAAQGTVTAPAVAQTGAITDPATVKGQLSTLQSEVTDALAAGDPMPVWARGAAEATKASMQARGMGASSMMAEALAEGIMKSAIPIAAADAATYKEMIFQNLNNRQQAAIKNANSYFEMDMANLSNNQQTSLVNLATRQSFLLSDQAASNAATQFNATSTNQVNQFYDSLSSQVAEQNVARSDAMGQFATIESNKVAALNAQNDIGVDTANANRQATINQFNATVDDARQRFNVENQRVVDQSNVQWRRALNTSNTAATNATNQLNAQNMLDLSNYAVSALWQQWRDEADWVNTASDNELARSHNAGLAALERTTELDLADESKKSKMYELLGKFGIAMFS